LLPLNSAAAQTGLLPSFNIAQGSAIRMSVKYPGEFVWFAIADPRKKSCAATLRKNLQAGAAGIGEMKFPLACDSPKLLAVYELAEEFQVPVLLHFQYGDFITALERFHRVASRYPRVNFIGHAQTWWGNIDLRHSQEQVWPYPTGRVTPNGITDRLLADCPNVYGDLSGNSGWNALTRDEDHARSFLSRHQDKLLFGSDCLHRGLDGPQCWGRQTLDALRRLAPSDTVLSKILWQNARRLLPSSLTRAVSREPGAMV
jgi:predicted TIM-barrel fold metal-dependent hydrolase